MVLEANIFSLLIAFTLLSFMVFGVSIIFHELGHILGLYLTGCRVEFRRKGINIGVTSPDLFKISNKAKSIIALFGIVAGWIPIILLTRSSKIIFIVFTIMYLAGCSKDIVLILKLGRKNDRS